jgi:dye decolorizing peroxidase
MSRTGNARKDRQEAMQETETTEPTEGAESAGLSRRRLLGAAGAAGAAGLVVGAGGTALGESLTADRPTALASVGTGRVPFHGTHQAGIAQPQQARMYAAAFDLTPAGADRKAVAALMRRWSSDAATMADGGAPPGDDGAALDAGPSSLTVTFGFGPALFDKTGLTAERPDALAELPPFPGDRIDAARSHGDLWVQVCADDPLVAFRALRVLQRRAAGTARLRWQMSGFSRAPGAGPAGGTPRNLMGMKDGTGNPVPGRGSFDPTVFVAAKGSPSWLANGSYVVFRRIRMLLDNWDVLPAARQERIVGRRKESGAPLSGGTEFTGLDLAATTPEGGFSIPADAHVRVAAAESNQGAALLRRGFSYHDGVRSDGELDAGLLFVCFQSDPLTGFVPIQRKLSRGDALSQFLVHESTGVYAVPGGAAEGGYVGQKLLES